MIGQRKNDNGWRTVKPYETIESLARKHGTTLERIRSLNGLSAAVALRPGNKIKVK